MGKLEFTILMKLSLHSFWLVRKRWSWTVRRLMFAEAQLPWVILWLQVVVGLRRIWRMLCRGLGKSMLLVRLVLVVDRVLLYCWRNVEKKVIVKKVMVKKVMVKKVRNYKIYKSTLFYMMSETKI